jgi:hypothetical protein
MTDVVFFLLEDTQGGGTGFREGNDMWRIVDFGWRLGCYCGGNKLVVKGAAGSDSQGSQRVPFRDQKINRSSNARGLGAVRV